MEVVMNKVTVMNQSYDESYDKSYDDRVMTSGYDKQSSYGPQQPSYDQPKMIISKALTMTIANTKPRIRNMSVEQVHSKASL